MPADPPVAVPGPASAHCTCPHATPNEASDEGFPCCAFGPCCCGSVPGPADPVVSPADTRGYVGPVAHEVTFDAQREPMFQDEHGNGWVPLATYEERCDERDALLAERDRQQIARLTEALKQIAVEIRPGTLAASLRADQHVAALWEVVRHYSATARAVLAGEEDAANG